ncbi:universal stress protein [Gelidibacter mesophilus]|uniref:universal stress protein n=1 Tax=Gelidibacter mesophilus TaxID=169050 RepID=UPI00041F9DFF|nr:universal stress protein [Gelidibacter mesophilus]
MKIKILLPTDFSENASQAIKYALELYKDQECLFYLLNVFFINPTNIESLIGMEPGSDLFEAAKKNSKRQLDQLLSEVAFGENGNLKHSFQTISTFNEPLQAIKSIVEEKDIDLIVMGTRGQTNTRSKIYGSNAIDVMEKIRNCPVIVVPQLAKRQLPKEIVFPTNYRTPFKKHELKHLINIVKICNASIKVLHVSEDGKLNEKQTNNKKLLDENFEEVSHSFHNLSQLSVAAAINCFVESRESDMVAFINSKHSFFASILNQPLVKGITYDSKVPILVMHDLGN